MKRKIATNHLQNPLPHSVTQPMRIFNIEPHVNLGVYCVKNKKDIRNGIIFYKNQPDETELRLEIREIVFKYSGRQSV